MEVDRSDRILGIIPARYQSSRFPAKMLARIAGKSLLQHTYENARQFQILDNLVIATDDARIFDHAKAFGGNVVMTSPNCATGTDRLAEVIAKHAEYRDAQIVVNLQGDAPCLDNSIVEQVVGKLVADPTASMSTAACLLSTREAALKPSNVKCVVDKNANALYFSRALIPASHHLDYDPKTTYYHHLGIYAYRTEFLLHYACLEPTPLQKAEDLEQLKVLEHGYRIKVAIVNQQEIPDVNTPEDIAKVEPILCQRNTSLLLAESAHP